MRTKPLGPRDKQWGMKAGLDVDGRMISLREMFTRGIRTIPPGALTPERKRDLALERIGQFPDYRLIVLGWPKPVGQKRALREIRNETALGRFLIETEQNIIHLMLIRARATRNTH